MDKVVNQVERETKQAQREMDKDIREFRKEVDSKINKALTNPLSAIAK